MLVEIKKGEEWEYVQTSYIPIFKPTRFIKKQGFSKNEYLVCPAFLDSETSHNHNRKNPYAWVYQWCFEFNGQIFVGRTPSELIRIMFHVKHLYNLSNEKRLVIFVHNLSYDYAYLYQFLKDAFGTPELLAIKSHKILSATFDCFEFRCSYMLSNMSLSVWGAKMGTEYRKIDCGIDYDIVRYQDSELTEEDWSYQVLDVLTLKDCIKKEMEFYRDNIATIPLTSTGYVRRDCRKAVSHDKDYRKMFNKTALDYDAYKLCKYAFMGGYTHGNRYYSGVTIDNVGHYDKKSHYPSQQQYQYFPISKLVHYYTFDKNKPMTRQEFENLCSSKCVLAVVEFTNLRLKKEVTAPFISKHKILNFFDCDFRNEIGLIGTDNGRVIKCKGNALIALTELDYQIYVEQYDFDKMEIIDVYTANRGQFPEQLRKVINDYFVIKETLPDGILRMKSKNKLNGIYGMTATNPVRDEWLFDYDVLEWSKNLEVDEKAMLEKYYKSRNSFMPFQFGVWTTAHARKEIYDLIKLIGYENFLYADTDSIFFRDSDKIRMKIDNYNDSIIQLNKQNNLGVKNIKGGISYYGTFEEEEFCDKFRFLHAKCYAYVSRETLHVTIAGVCKNNKQLGDKLVTSAEELQSIENLYDGFTFKECGGTTALYVEKEIETLNIDNHETELASACILYPSEKEIGGTLFGFYEWESE